jgi:fumarate reductase flavoprotein subunit
VGGGGAGVAAALRASEEGKRVVLLEKAGSIGGSTAMCRGIGAVGSREQEAAPECDFTVNDLYDEYMRQTNFLADSSLVRLFLSESGRTVDWLQDNGAVMDYVGNAQAKHIGSKLKTYFNWGPEKIRQMRAMVQTVCDRGGAVLVKCPAKRLLTENGKISGIIAEKDGQEIEISCPVVILCSGGFGNNEEMVLKATGGVKVNMINSGGQTGDGITMGIEAGADTDNIDSIEFHGVSMPFDKVRITGAHGTPGVLGFMVNIHPAVWVNKNAVRFVNEEIADDISFSGNVAFRQGSNFFNIMSQSFVDGLLEKGLESLGFQVPGIVPDAAGWQTLPKELSEGIECGYVYKADTIEELAGKMGVNAEKFAATVERYNSFCASGHDGDFGKNPKYLIPIDKAPYYAVEYRAAELCSLGGLRINTELQVTDKNLRPIPGLYAAGCDASGGLFNNAYVSLEGMTIGWAFTSGRLAGESACRYLGE